MIGQSILALSRIALGALPILIMPLLVPIVTLAHTPAALAAIPYAPTAPVLIALALLTLLCGFAIFARPKTVRTYSTWECGFGSLAPRGTIASGSFARGFAGMFGPLLRYRTEAKIKGRDRRHFPESMVVETEIKPPIETYIYAPLLGGFQLAGKMLTNLQTASIHVHLLYVFASIFGLLVLGRFL